MTRKHKTKLPKYSLKLIFHFTFKITFTSVVFFSELEEFFFEYGIFLNYLYLVKNKQNLGVQTTYSRRSE